MKENNNDVVVFCLKCEKKEKTEFRYDTSCLQCTCCLLLIVTPPLCLVPFCCDSCKEKYHVCSKCGSVLWEEVPGEEIKH